jgi:hypothetical protein
VISILQIKNEFLNILYIKNVQRLLYVLSLSLLLEMIRMTPLKPSQVKSFETSKSLAAISLMILLTVVSKILLADN